MKRLGVTAGWGMLAILGWTGLSGSAQARSPLSDPIWQAVAEYRVGQDPAVLRAALAQVDQALAEPAHRPGLEANLIRLLDSGSTLGGKRFICRQLGRLGSPAALSALAARLGDAATAVMARTALAGVPGPEPDRLFLAALPRLTGKCQAGVIISLDHRRSSEAELALVPLATSPDPEVAGAAISALGNLGGSGAVQTLEAVLARATPGQRPLIVDALMLCAERGRVSGQKDTARRLYRRFYQRTEAQHVRLTAMGGLLALSDEPAAALLLPIFADARDNLRPLAADQVRRLRQPGFTQALVAGLPELPVPVQALLVVALGDRGDTAALPAVLNYLRSPDESLQTAALEALGALGGVDQVPLLIDWFRQGGYYQKRAARHSLERLRGQAVDAALCLALDGASEETAVVLVECLMVRRAATAVPTLLQLSQTSAPTVQAGVFRALGLLAGPEDLPRLERLLGEARGEAVAWVRQAVATAQTRWQSRVLR